MTEKPTFNLWSEPWIQVEQATGGITRLSLQEVLRRAHTLRALYDPSPLVVAAVHRHLVAILQAAYAPQVEEDLVAIWRAGRFNDEPLNAFGTQYADRFDLFDEEAPFMQTSDLAQAPAKGDKAKPVGYLLQEQPAGTAVTHYNHAYDEEQFFCSHCLASGLLLQPAFATSEGKGFRPSINGVPPIYILPGGNTLFRSLTASLTTEPYQPGRPANDVPWWNRPRPTKVSRSEEIRRVGYLQSLTFAARRIRIHPKTMEKTCTRCGGKTTWGASTIVFEMGESRPQTAAFWRDPFAAYRMPGKGRPQPTPVRPVEGRALWREFGALFLPGQAHREDSPTVRPALLDQLELLRHEAPDLLPDGAIPLRAVGLRTDKAKVLEWEESGFNIPSQLLSNAKTARYVSNAIDFATSVESKMVWVFRKNLAGDGKSERLIALRQQMSRDYWQALGPRFLDYVARHGGEQPATALYADWLGKVVAAGIDQFTATVDNLPADGPTLHACQAALKHCRAMLFKLRKDHLPINKGETV